MLQAVMTRIIATATRRPVSVIACAAVLAAASGIYAARHFAINTDTSRLMPPSLGWVQTQRRYEKAFPPRQVLAVVQAPTPELAGLAAAKLAEEAGKQSDAIRSVLQPQGGGYLARESMLFLPPDQLAKTTAQLERARPLLGALAADPTLRGVMQAMAGALREPHGNVDVAAGQLADTLDAVFAGRYAAFSWQALLQGKPPSEADRRQFLQIDPVLDFRALQPGKNATAAIRQAVDRSNIGPDDGAHVSLTGAAPVNDDQFATLSNGAALNGAGTALAVLVILWLALRSPRIILAVVLSLLAGLAMTAAAGLLLVGAFNLISVAFAVLFIGLGADFGIQYSVRYRAERHDTDDVRAALRGAGRKAGSALALAAAGVTAGFWSFLPTDYRGVSELGEIAGAGMLIAFCTTITLLPALLALLRPPGEPERMGYAFLAPVDSFLGRHRIAVVACTILVVVAGLPLLAWLRFDFDPMHLQDPNGEAVRTYRQLAGDPASGVAAVDVVTPSLDAAQALAGRLDALPQVAGTRTVHTLVPADQDAKLPVIRHAAAALLPALPPQAARPAPSDPQTVAAIRTAAAALGPSAAERRLHGLLLRLAEADPSARQAADRALAVPLKLDLDRLRASLAPRPVTVADVPDAMRREWLLPDGRARVQLLPKGNQDDTAVLARFARAVQSVAPDASGPPVTLLQSERTVVRAFIEAGCFAVLAIAVILYLALRRVGDVLLTLVPLLVAAAVTLEITVLTGQALNFANIIALPLLLGVGVAFKIYYILAWRRGATQLLQSTLTRAVFFSALTTMTAFGSLWLSNDPGMSSMGKLMALALVCTLAAAVLFQPALMGPPRTVEREGRVPAAAKAR